jgi:hypothetical protein
MHIEKTAYTSDREPKAQVFGMDKMFIANFRLAVLEACRWNRVQAARYLGINYKTLRNFIAELEDFGIYVGEWDRMTHLPPDVSQLDSVEKWAFHTDFMRKYRKVYR